MNVITLYEMRALKNLVSIGAFLQELLKFNLDSETPRKYMRCFGKTPGGHSLGS